MASFNKVILMGNLTRDPELRYTPKGTAIAKLGLAVNRVWKTETGETKEDVLFIDVEAFSRQAETIGQYLKKGSPVLVEGRLRLDTWDDKQTNQKRSKILVTAENVRFLGSGQPREGGAPETARSRPPATAAAEGRAAARTRRRHRRVRRAVGGSDRHRERRRPRRVALGRLELLRLHASEQVRPGIHGRHDRPRSVQAHGRRQLTVDPLLRPV